MDSSGQIYNYLYWEGINDTGYDFSQGYCVAGRDTAAFLEDALSQLGLTRREANEFIVYWLPLMQDSPYNLIAFQSDAYTQAALLPGHYAAGVHGLESSGQRRGHTGTDPRCPTAHRLYRSRMRRLPY